MVFRPILRVRHPVWGIVVLWFTVGGLLGFDRPSSAQVVIRQGRPVPAGSAENEDYFGVFLPMDRTQARAMARAQQRLQEGEYHQTLGFLNEILGREEDTFLDDSPDSKQLLGLKATARRLIAELPPEGRQAYQLLFKATARRELEAALAAGSREDVARVVRQYFHTSAGWEATLILAQMEFDSGHPLAAAQLYQELLDTPQAAQQFEPQLTALAALSWSAAGDHERTDSLLRSLAERFQGETIHVAGRPVRVPAPGDDLTAWLQQAIGQPKQVERTDQDWITHRGNAARNARDIGGAPHLRARWEARVVNDPRVESLLASRSPQLTQQSGFAVPAAQPIAVGDVVLMRTPANVVAVDWQTGKRIWETRDETNERLTEFADGLTVIVQDEDWPESNLPLEQRVWEDVLAMSLSSDGERVFVVGGLPLSSAEDAGRWGMMPVFGGPDNMTGVTNRLTAYELATEGKLVWELDGGSPTGDFAGAFFLGPPLAVHDSLYVIAEIRGALYLLALEPRTGQLQWQQQLANLEQAIALDPLRRLNGATPSYSAGILVCPTGAGVIIAVDVVKRQFAWVYRYPSRTRSLADMRVMWQQRLQQQQIAQDERWLDGDVVLSNGHVFVTPPESDELHCLDLRTGELLWKRMRDDYLFIGCVDQQTVLLVGSESLGLLREQDGTPRTPNERLALPAGAYPAGHGYLSNGRYYLPLTNGQIVAVDLDRAEIAETIQPSTEMALGNLISHRGTVISQSALVLDKFEQMELLRRRTAATLAHNPDDATALRELAEIRRVDGELTEAVELLKRAYLFTPDDPLIREMLSETLLDALASDYASHQDDLPLLEELITGQEQRLDLLRIRATGLQTLGRRTEAFEAYARMADVTQLEPLNLRVGTQHAVRSDRWIRGHLSTLWSEADSREREVMESALAARRLAWGEHPTATQLQHYLAHFDGLPGTDDVRIQLARQLIESQHVQQAELELLRLEQSSTSETQAAAAVLMARLMLKTDRREAVRPYAAALAGQWSDVVALDGKTGREWLHALGLEGEEELGANGRRWPSGRVVAEVIPTSARSKGRTSRRVQDNRHPFLRQLRLEQEYPSGISSLQWFISNDCGMLVGRNSWGEDDFRFDIRREREWSAYRVSSHLVQAAQLGHLLYVSLGHQIVALDSRLVGENEVLWQAHPAGVVPPTQARGPARRNVMVFHSASGRQRVFGPDGALAGSLGPATPEGVVFLEQGQLKCVDPLTGDTLWARSDVPAGCELFGDDELVFAADVERRVAQVFSTVDGTLLGERKLPKFPWLLTAGRNVAKVEYESGPRAVVRILDLWTDETLYEEECNTAARFTVVEPQLLLVVEPSGKLRCLDTRFGKVLLDQQLDPTKQLGRIQAMRSQDELIVVIDTDAPEKHRPIGPDYPLVTGQVYVFDLLTNQPLWPGPAVVSHRGISLSQPESIPLLVFVDREERRDATSGGSSHLRLLCLDKRTGQSVFRDDELPDTSVGQFRVSAEWGSQPSVNVEMSTRTVRLSLTDEPRPPEPPANDLVERDRKSLGQSLWSVGQKMGDALQEALRNPGGTIWPVPASKPLQPAGDQQEAADHP